MHLLTQDTEYIGNISARQQADDFSLFFRTACEIRTALGENIYLLDDYLTRLFDCANEIIYFTAEKQGCNAVQELIMMCEEPISNSELVLHPFFDQAKRYINSHPLPPCDITIRPTVYAALLSGSYLQYIAKNYAGKLNAELTQVLDAPEMQTLQLQIISSLGYGGKAKLRRLQALFVKRFLTAPSTAMFLQGATDQLLYILTLRDNRTGTPVLQFLSEQAHNLF